MVTHDYPQEPGELFYLDTSYRAGFYESWYMYLPTEEEALLGESFIPRKAKILNNTPMLYLGIKSIYSTEYSTQKQVRYSFLTTSESGCAVEVFVLRSEADQAFHTSIGWLKRCDNT
jgi:hypothetical protein